MSIEKIDRMLTIYALKQHLAVAAANWDEDQGGRGAVQSLKMINEFCQSIFKDLDSDNRFNTLNAVRVILTSCQKFIFAGERAVLNQGALNYPPNIVNDDFIVAQMGVKISPPISSGIRTKIKDFVRGWEDNGFPYFENIEWSEIAMAVLITPELVLSHLVGELRSKAIEMSGWQEDGVDKDVAIDINIKTELVQSILNDSYFSKVKSYFPIKNERALFSEASSFRNSLDFRSSQRLMKEPGLSNHLVIALPLDADIEDIKSLLEKVPKYFSEVVKYQEVKRPRLADIFDTIPLPPSLLRTRLIKKKSSIINLVSYLILVESGSLEDAKKILNKFGFKYSESSLIKLGGPKGHEQLNNKILESYVTGDLELMDYVTEWFSPIPVSNLIELSVPPILLPK
ncbi:MAG: hypothetical protein RPS47_05945 [Colwellia sp.]